MSGRRPLWIASLVASFLAVGGVARPAQGGPAPQATFRPTPAFDELETGLENLRRLLRIPGLAAGVMAGGELVWAKGFGYADLEKRVDAAADTPWHIASVAKTLSAVIVLQLVEEGKLSLDDPLERFGIPSGRRGTVRVRHILSHTSERTPGTFFRYSGRLWEHLAQVIRMVFGETLQRQPRRADHPASGPQRHRAQPGDRCGGLSLRKPQGPLGRPLHDGRRVPSEEDGIRPRILRRRRHVHFDPRHGRDPRRPRRGTVVEARFGRKRCSLRSSTPSGKALPHGLGWFVQTIHGRRVIWHFGWHPDHASALLVRVPERNVSFMVFANSDKLSQPFNLLRGNVLNSPAALLFLKNIAFRGEISPRSPSAKPRRTTSCSKPAGGSRRSIRGRRRSSRSASLSFLSAPLFWAGALLARRGRRRGVGTAPIRFRFGPFLGRSYALFCALLAVMFCAALARAPFLAYWPELPGWIDGISLFENVVLAAPTVLALLGTGMIGFTFLAWFDKYWTPLERMHYAWLTVCLAAFVALLARWHLVGIAFYWAYFIR